MQPASAARPRSAAGDRDRSVSAWLAENGLAWIGGGALALGGLFLAAYAANRGFFTPALRIAAAVVAGAAMLAASEWIRRARRAPGGRHRLAAAMAAGAGAATLYAAIWAAHALYGFVSLPAAAVLLAALCFGLLALSLLHPEPLALLAVAGAFAVPLVAGDARWPSLARDAYLVMCTVTGFGSGGLRRWRWAWVVTLALAFLWSISDVFATQASATLAIAWTVCAVAAVDLRVSPAVRGPALWRTRFGAQPTAAILLAAVVLLLLWVAAGDRHDRLTAVGVAGAALAAAMGWAVARRLSPAWLIVAPAFVGVCGPAVNVSARPTTPSMVTVIWAFAGGAVLAMAALAAGRRAGARPLLHAAAAVSLVLLVGVGWPTFHAAYPRWDWVAPAGVAVGLLAAAYVASRETAERLTDLATGFWTWGAGLAGIVAVFTGVDPALAPAAYAVYALVAAALVLRPGWRGFPEICTAAALAAFAAHLHGGFAGAALAGRLGTAHVALVGIASVAVLLGAWMVLRRARAAALHADAVVTTALACGLATAFLLLRVWATPTGETPPTLSPGTEAALRTLMLLTAGVALGMARTDGSVIARWRGEALLLAGLVHGVLWQGMFHNPLGFWAGEVSGPPLLDELTLGYIAPAGLLLGAGAMRVRRGDRRAGPYGFAGLLWAALAILLEIRRAFHGRVLNAGPELPAEMACYGLAALCLALVAAALPEALRTRASWETTAARIARSAAIVGWPAVALSALMFWSYASPWWGPLGVALRSAGDADLLFGVYAAGVAVSLALAHPRLRLGPELARAALVCAVTDLFALLTLVIRYAFQGPDMRAGLREVSLETWTYSAVWALFGLGLLLTGGIRRSPTMRWLALLTLLATAAKVFLFDMARLQGVIRAASFLALGALLLLGALAARRLNAGAGVFGRASGDRDGG